MLSVTIQKSPLGGINQSYEEFQCIRLNGLYKPMDSFFPISNSFSNYWPKPENIQMNSDAWILITLQCVIYQWIWLDKLYKLMECFFFLIFHLLKPIANAVILICFEMHWRVALWTDGCLLTFCSKHIHNCPTILLCHQPYSPVAASKYIFALELKSS